MSFDFIETVLGRDVIERVVGKAEDLAWLGSGNEDGLGREGCCFGGTEALGSGRGATATFGFTVATGRFAPVAYGLVILVGGMMAFNIPGIVLGVAG